MLTHAACQASMTRMCARLEIRTGRLGQVASDRSPRVASRKGARSASEMQSCWLDKHAARAAAKQLPFQPLRGRARRALRALVRVRCLRTLHGARATNAKGSGQSIE